MSDQDGTNVQESQTEQPQQQIDLEALAQKIAKIKTEDGRQKYDTVEKAIDSIPHKDEFIEQLKSEVATERTAREQVEQRLTELENKVTIEEKIADRIASQQGQVETPSSVDIDEQKLSEIVEQQIANMDTKRTREANANKFVKAIASETNDVEKFISDKANDLGIGEQTFQDIISQSPDAALKLVGLKPSDPVKTKSNVNTVGYQEKPEKKTSLPPFFTTDKQRTSRVSELRAELEAKYGLR